MAKIGFYIALFALIYLLASAGKAEAARENNRCIVDDDCVGSCGHGVGVCDGKQKCVCKESKEVRIESGPPCRWDDDCKACGSSSKAFCDLSRGACWCP